MCPACVATVALIAASAPTMGGQAALGVKKLRAKAGAATGADSINPETQVKGTKEHESSENRDAR